MKASPSVKPTRLDNLIFALLEAKAEMARAKQAYTEIEDQVLAEVGHKDEGTQHQETAFYKVTTTGRMNRTVDERELRMVQDSVPGDIFSRVFRFKPALDLKEYRFIQNNEPEIFQLVSSCVTSKPGKPGLKVEEL